MCKKCESCEKSYAANLQLCPYCKRVNWIVQAWASLSGWMDCKSATTLESATQQAASLASRPSAWMGAANPRTSEEFMWRYEAGEWVSKFKEWVRIIPLECANTKKGSYRNVTSVSERRPTIKTCIHSYSGNEYFRGFANCSQPGATPSYDAQRVCVKCGFAPESLWALASL